MAVVNHTGKESDSSQYQIVFRGEILPDYTEEEVRERLAKGLKLDENKASKLFCGKKIALKTFQSLNKARKMAAAFSGIGAVVSINRRNRAIRKPFETGADSARDTIIPDSMATAALPQTQAAVEALQKESACNSALLLTDNQL